MKTALYDAHKAAKARMVDFAGWDMPVQYADGLITEHHAVRNNAGLFDVSHMGQLMFRGPDAVGMVNRLITNDLTAIGNGQAQYTTICNDDGKILDDAISYRLKDDEILMVVNASNVGKIDAWVTERATGDAQMTNVSDQYALLALQGPKALAIADRVVPGAGAMKPFQVRQFGDLILATTGYTGEAGFEIFVAPSQATELWNALLEAGKSDGLVPVGLGARDTLRLEMKYSLYGNDIDETTHPLEAGLGWVTKLNKEGGFIGRDALQAVKDAGVSRRLVGIQILDKGIARHGYDVYLPAGSTPSGVVTSGTKSPSTGKAIAMAYVDTPHHKVGSKLEVDMRGRRLTAEVVKTPFYRKEPT